MSLSKHLPRLVRQLAAPAAICAGLLVAAPARAATMQLVSSGWQVGTEPSYISMYEYIPSTLATNPPILVVVHYCGGSASGIFGEAQGGGIISKADSEGFIIVLPQLMSGRNCWDVATTASLTHGGGGDTGAIVDMVKYEIKTRNANANRVYSIGSSSGAMMTEALLAVYPDVFKGGAEFAGVPAGCWSVSYTASNQWSGPCAGGQVTHTAADWGTMVRNMYPGYNGFRPRIQLWHGTADTTISPVNQTEAIKQWTNVLGLPTNPTTTTTVTIGSGSYMRQQWTDASCGITLLDAWTENNGPHGTDANMNGQYSLPFMNLDKTPFAATDPQTACSSSGTGGNSGTAGVSGAAGTSGGGGRGGTTGTAGTTGTTGTGGRGGTTGAGGNPNNTVGTAGTTGTSGGAGTTGGGNNGGSGTTGTSTGTAGTSATGLAGNNGGSGATGTSTGTAGNSSTGAAGDNSTGAAGDNGSGSGGTSGITTVAPGCACNVTRGSGALDAFALAGMIAVVFRRRRAKRAADKR
jgi:poly(hydroxyalkanoate) depolymerase family esterase